MIRWGWLGAVAGVVLIAVFVGAKSQTRAQSGSREEAAVLAADTALGRTLRGGDKRAARRLLALQFTFIDAAGTVHPRRVFLADLKAAAAAPAADAAVRRFGRLAMVTGHRQSIAGSEVFFLDVWARQKGAWRALVMQHVDPVPGRAPPLAAAQRAVEGSPAACKNPCQTIPYRVRSPAEQDVVNAYQSIVKAVAAHDPESWGKRVTASFALHSSGRAPVAKSGRMAAIGGPNASGAATIGEVQAMRLAVYGDGAVMTTNEAVRGQASYRSTRVFVRRNGQWQMAISTRTDVE